MNVREAMRDMATKWISLWTAPVDWDLFDAIHAEDFEDCAPAGRASTKERIIRRWGEWDVTGHAGAR